MVSGQGVFGGCGIWDATAGARHHPAFGHQPLRGRLTRLVMEAAGMLMASADGSFDFAQDDGTGGLGNQMACFGLVRVMRLRRISIRRYRRALLQGATD